MATRNRTASGPQMAHPLCGANPGTLVPALLGNGGIGTGQTGRALGALGAALGRLPLSLAERAWMSLRVPATLEQPPVFIIGHWRSGTTHLYNIMSRGDFAYVPPVATGLPWDMLLIGRAFRRVLDQALPDSRLIDNVPVEPDSPQEDEIALASMTRHSFYHALYFPERFDRNLARGLWFEGVDAAGVRQWQHRVRHLYTKLAHAQDGRRLLIKNPVYTGRVAMLAGMFPGARFVNMIRNPYDVFVSMRNFYAKLLPELALQDHSGVDIDQAVLQVFPRLIDAQRRDTATLAPGHFTELRYEDLESDPLSAIERIYTDLELPGFDNARPAFDAYLGSVRSYRKNRFEQPAEVIELVNRHWARHFDDWGYEMIPVDTAAATVPATGPDDPADGRQALRE